MRFSFRTSLYGSVVAVLDDEHGDAKVKFETIDDLLVSCKVKADLVPVLRACVGQRVGVSGMATWDIEDYDLVEFEIEEILNYRYSSIVDAFKELRDIAGDCYDGVDDVVKYIDRLRYDHVDDGRNR